MLLRENYTAEHILRLREETGADLSILETDCYREGDDENKILRAIR